MGKNYLTNFRKFPNSQPYSALWCMTEYNDSYATCCFALLLCVLCFTLGCHQLAE